MKKSIVTLALLIVIAAQDGFPETWKYRFITLAALLIVALVLIPRKDAFVLLKKKEVSTFTENAPESKEKEEIKITHA
ncbi:MAG: hypothetical protein NT098_05600 [Candidatus Parcubacteria bacterium]|nr:hypothetical protein [Candidatus Parcubacteria bacterium]